MSLNCVWNNNRADIHAYDNIIDVVKSVSCIYWTPLKIESRCKENSGDEYRVYFLYVCIKMLFPMIFYMIAGTDKPDINTGTFCSGCLICTLE
jgi:hypothetical protein